RETTSKKIHAASANTNRRLMGDELLTLIEPGEPNPKRLESVDIFPGGFGTSSKEEEQLLRSNYVPVLSGASAWNHDRPGIKCDFSTFEDEDHQGG
ncbi:unnamed protein product, partial [Amoebophrya sp. A120]